MGRLPEKEPNGIRGLSAICAHSGGAGRSSTRVASRSAVEATPFVQALSLPPLSVANPPWVSPSVEARVPARCPVALGR
jgi:hypothetical protein